MSVVSPEDTSCLQGDPWITLQTFGGTEFELERDIFRAGFHPYLPRHTETRPRPGRHFRATIEITRPLFSGYLFVRGNHNAAHHFVSCDFNTTKRIVKRLPTLLPNSALEAVRMAEERANRSRWQEWAPDLQSLLRGFEEALMGVLPKRFTRLEDLRRTA